MSDGNRSAYAREYYPPREGSGINNFPRFGHTNDLSRLFSNDPQEAKDYVVGLIFLGCLLGAIYLIWLILLLCFRCCGPRRAGYLSGARMERPIPDDVHEQLLVSQKSGSKTNNSLWMSPPGTAASSSPEAQPTPLMRQSQASKDLDDIEIFEPNSCANMTTRVRSVFITSGLIFITFAVCIVTQGITNLQSTIDTVNDNAVAINEISMEVEYLLTAGLQSVQTTAGNVRSLLVEELNRTNFCPANPSLDTSQSGQDLRNMADEAVTELGQLDSFINNQDVGALADAANQVSDLSNTILKQTDNIDLTDWQSLIILIPFTVVPSLMIAGTVMAMYDVSSRIYVCFLNWFIFPIFLVQVLIMCFMSVAMSISAGINGDFCLPGGEPDQNNPNTVVLSVLAEEGYSNATDSGRVLAFYVQQCSGNDPFAFLRAYIPDLDKAEQGLQQLFALIQDQTVITELSLYCNRDFSKLIPILTDMQDVITVVVDAARQALDLISCARIVPIYTSIVYDGTCDYSIAAVWWVFISSLILSIFGLLMITFRTSYKPTHYYVPTVDLQIPGENDDVYDDDGREIDPNDLVDDDIDPGLRRGPAGSLRGSSAGPPTLDDHMRAHDDHEDPRLWSNVDEYSLASKPNQSSMASSGSSGPSSYSPYPTHASRLETVRME